MLDYLQLLNRVLSQPAVRGDRTGTGTRAVFAPQMQFGLQEGFPLLTTKKVFFRGVVEELLWMLSGSTNVKPLQEQGVHIWDEWANESGNLGPVYGAQWRSWPISEERGLYVDQMAELIARLKADPFSRRHVVSAWNVAQLDEMRLPPCHCLFQFFVSEATFSERAKFYGKNVGLFTAPDKAIALSREMDAAGVPTLSLHCQLYQRSADLFLGVPFNIASYALLTHMVAQCVGMIPVWFAWTGGDTHLYLNHEAQAKEQLSRKPGPLPRLWLNDKVTDLFSFKSNDISILNYDPQGAIPAPVSV